MVDLKFSRILHSLVTTSARSIKVNGDKRLSFEQFISEGQKLLKQVNSDYPHEPGVRGFYLLSCDDLFDLDGYSDNIIIQDTVKVHEEFIETFKSLFSSAAHKWYSVPGNELRYDFTDLNKTLEMFMVGAALSLLPWRDDNTCQLTMHGKQIDPGHYCLKMVDMFIFERELPSQHGPFRSLSVEIDYSVIITEDYIRLKRKMKGRKAVNLKKQESRGMDQSISKKPFKKPVNKRDLGRGI